MALLTPDDRDEFARTVAGYFATALAIPLDRVYGRTRAGGPTLVRQLTWLHLRRLLWSLDEIGDAFGREHSTVHSQLAVIERRVRYDTDLQGMCNGAPCATDRVFTETSLVALYARLTRLVAEAVDVKSEIDLSILRERDIHVGKSQFRSRALNTVSA